MNICEKLISSCISADCNNPIYTGVGQVAYIFNFQDIEGLVTDPDNPNLITSLTLREVSEGVTATGYKIVNLGRTPFTGSNTAFSAGNIQNKFTETVSFVVPDASATAAQMVDNLANGKFVIVLENEYNGSDGTGKFQLYGGLKGLIASDISRDPYSTDTDGAYAITLTSENVPNSGLYLQHQDDTRAYLESITDACQA